MADNDSLTMERRGFDSEFTIETRDDGGQRLVGYAAMFDRYSEPMIDWGGYKFVEIIRSGAFDAALAEEQDVRALWNHRTDQPPLGRTSANTLALSKNKTGLRYTIDLPDTQLARDLVVSVERGDVNGSSFGFRVRPDGDKIVEQENRTIRELLSVDLYDVSPVVYPAYKATEGQLHIRSLDEWREHAAQQQQDLDTRRRNRMAAQIRLARMRGWIW